MTKETPLIFDAESVRQLLLGRKTQTRRFVVPQPSTSTHTAAIIEQHPSQKVAVAEFIDGATSIHRAPCRYGKVGDRLWVKESFAVVPWTAYARSEGVVQTRRPDPTQPDGYDTHDAAIYRAGWTRSGGHPWRSSLYMPRWASRIMLAITRIRVERVRDISGEDARAELGSGRYEGDGDAYIRFRARWQEINGRAYGARWEDNPWCWCIDFVRVT